MGDVKREWGCGGWGGLHVSKGRGMKKERGGGADTPFRTMVKVLISQSL